MYPALCYKLLILSNPLSLLLTSRHSSSRLSPHIEMHLYRKCTVSIPKTQHPLSHCSLTDQLLFFSVSVFAPPARSLSSSPASSLSPKISSFSFIIYYYNLILSISYIYTHANILLYKVKKQKVKFFIVNN